MININKKLDYNFEDLSLFHRRFTGRNVIKRINDELGKISDDQMKELILSYFEEVSLVAYTRYLVTLILSVLMLLLSFVIFSWITFGLSIFLYLSSKYFDDVRVTAVRNRNFSEAMLDLDVDENE